MLWLAERLTLDYCGRVVVYDALGYLCNMLGGNHKVGCRDTGQSVSEFWVFWDFLFFEV